MSNAQAAANRARAKAGKAPRTGNDSDAYSHFSADCRQLGIEPCGYTKFNNALKELFVHANWEDFEIVPRKR